MMKPPLLQRMLGALGLKSRDRIRSASANFNSALLNRLTNSWTQTTLSADAQARTDLKILRARSRELRDNNNYAQRFAHMLKSNVLGENGIHFRCKAKEIDKVVAGRLVPGAPDIYANKTIEDAWYRWGRKEYCTVTGKLTWSDVQNVVLESVATDGEAVIRKIYRSKKENPFGFCLQLLDAELIDTEYNCILPNGNEVRMGVELDEWHKPVGYWLLRQNPSDLFFFHRSQDWRYRLDASEIIHLFKSRRPDQTRGIPWSATAAAQLNMLGKYQEAEVVAARVSASRPAFLSPEDANAEYVGEKDSDGNKYMDTEAGSIEQLPYKMNLVTPDWNHPNTSYGAFVKDLLREIASGLGVSYNTLANDMESVNFASGKLGLEDERQFWRSTQCWFIESFCEEIYAEFLRMSLSTGEIPLPMTKFDKFNVPEFKGRTWSYINPVQEVTAKIAQLNAGLTSQSRILAEQNMDRDELLDEIAADRAAAEARDLSFSEVTTEDPAELQAELDAEAAGMMPPDDQESDGTMATQKKPS